MYQLATNRKDVIQPRLEIGRPDDKYEKEADAVADRVMHMPSSGGFQMTSGTQSPGIQMKCAKCEEEEKVQMKPSSQIGKSLQMKPESGGVMASTGLTSLLNSSKGSGQPLPDKVRGEMGAKIGTDFSGVKVHTGSNAIQMSREIGAQAFTHGSDIYFNQGKYDPESSEGKHLLAHELAHVVQQSYTATDAFPIQRMLACPATLNASDPVPEGFKAYQGNSSWFHCGFRGILEDRVPSPEDPQNECFYDDSGVLVDESHEAAGCRGTPNDYDSSASTWDHIFNDRGGIWHRGWDAYWTSRGYEKVQQIDECREACNQDNALLRSLCLSGCLDEGHPMY